MKGFTYKESIDRLEKEIKNASGGGGGGGTAADVSYDNTSSGLTAGNVQAAIDEIDSNVDTLSGSVTTLSGDVTDLKAGHVYSTTEHAYGKWTDNSIVYEKTIELGTLPNATSATAAHGISDFDKVIEIFGVAISTSNQVPLPFTNNTSAASQIAIIVDANNITVRTGEDKSSYTGYLTLRYTKSASNAKKQKSSK